MKLSQDQGFSLVIVLAAVAFLAVAGFTAWRIYDAAQQPRAVDNNQNIQQTELEPDAGHLAEKLKADDGSVQLSLPEGWRSSRKPTIEAQGCLMVRQPERGDCVLRADLIPKGYTGESQWIIAVFKTNITAKTVQAFYEATVGLPNENFAVVNDDEINGYSSHYVNIVEQSYVDHNYFITHDNTLVYLHARESSKHFGADGAVDEVVDNSEYTPGFVKLVQSIQFK